MRAPLLTVLAVLILAVPGCLNMTSVQRDEGAQAQGVELVGGVHARVVGGPGAVSTLEVVPPAAGVKAQVPTGVLVQDAEGRLRVPSGPVELPARLFVPPGARSLSLKFLMVDGAEIERQITLSARALGDVSRCERLVCGARIVSLFEEQRDTFPHRTPGHENYLKSQAHFAEYFRALGYEVEVDPYGTNAGQDLPGFPYRGIKANSVANVVAYKAGTANPPRYIIFGGHYDVVETTIEGAYDNTGGTIATLEMARAFANLTTQHTLVFALWGGEEDGVLGSNFFASTNPDVVRATSLYVNFDALGISWPGPLDVADPIELVAGPDGPLAKQLLAQGGEVAGEWFGFTDALFRYTPSVEGQAGGGASAQSDHVAFMTRGVPSIAYFAGDLKEYIGHIHKPDDSLANLTAYMVRGTFSDDPLLPAEEIIGRTLLAESYEVPLWHAFYFANLVDDGYFRSRLA